MCLLDFKVYTHIYLEEKNFIDFLFVSVHDEALLREEFPYREYTLSFIEKASQKENELVSIHLKTTKYDGPLYIGP